MTILCIFLKEIKCRILVFQIEYILKTKSFKESLTYFILFHPAVYGNYSVLIVWQTQ